jgi:hypothetical protein
MLTEIKTEEIMTKNEAYKKYPTKYFIMIITERVDYGDNDLGYVLYTADTRKELSQAPRESYIDLGAAILQGDEIEPFPIVGNVVYHAQV